MDEYQRHTSEKCVYTVVSYDVIQNAFENGGRISFTENQLWTTAYSQLQEADKNKSIYLVLLADAAKLKGVKWIARIEEIDLLPDNKTKITIRGLINLGLPMPFLTLTLQDIRTSIIDVFKKPYVLCATPDFAEEEIELTLDFWEGVEEYKIALVEIEDQITPGQMKMLVGHYAAPGMKLSVKKLAEVAGYNGDRSGSLRYGKLARLISETLGEDPPTSDRISAIAYWEGDVKDERGHGQWTLNHELARAMEELGWVDPSTRQDAIAEEKIDDTVTFVDEEDDFYSQVISSFNDSNTERLNRLATANQTPEKIVVISTAFKRNPDVVAEVLHRANGMCELCGSPAPFKRKTDRTPYLEVHHRIRLADGGLDCVENAIALCPNCHRENHYG